MSRGKPDVRGCGHRYPVVVEPSGGQQRWVRCPGCGASGPERGDAEQALLALRAEDWDEREPVP